MARGFGAVMGDVVFADPQWVKAAVSRYEGPLTLYAARIVGDTERARDAVQETFLRLCKQLRSDVEGHLAEWLYMVCRNCALDMRRRTSRSVQLDEESPRASVEPGPAEVVESRESAFEALRLLSGLSDNQQEVLRLKFQHSLSYKQISAVTGLSVSNVGFLIHTALKSLRAQMTGGEPTKPGERR